MRRRNRVIRGLIAIALIFSTAAANAAMTAAEIRAVREMVEAEKDQEALEKLSPEERADRQALIDAEVTQYFKKRIQMRPSDVERIDPACDEWLKLYKETGWAKAKNGIATTCP